MRWIRRLLLCAVLALLLLLAAAGVGYRMLHGRPDWYRPGTPDAGQSEQTAKRAEDKLTEASNWSQSVWLTKQHPAQHPQPAPFTLSLSDDEINAFLSKWEQIAKETTNASAYISDWQVSLADGQLILAGTVKDLDSIVSVHLAPRIDEKGLLHADVQQVMGGQLPLPQALWNSYANKLATKLRAAIPEAQRKAKLYPDGSANDQMATAVLGKMMLDFLHGDAADSVIFMKYPAGNELKNLPVRIKSLQIADKTVTMTFEPLAAGEKIGDAQ